MRKFLLTTIVGLSFFGYVLFSRRAPDEGTVIPPKNVQTSPRPSIQAVNSTTLRKYKDGEYTGPSVDAYYGFVQVKASIKSGKITDVKFLSYPNDRQTSLEINSQAMPYLISEAIQAQSANVNIVSGATDTSQAFQESLGAALAQAK